MVVISTFPFTQMGHAFSVKVTYTHALLTWCSANMVNQLIVLINDSPNLLQ